MAARTLGMLSFGAARDEAIQEVVQAMPLHIQVAKERGEQALRGYLDNLGIAYRLVARCEPPSG